MKTKSKRFISILLSAIMIASMSFTQLTAYAQEPEQPAIEDAEIITTGTEAEVQAEIVEVSENSDTDTFIPAYSQELLSAYTKLFLSLPQIFQVGIIDAPCFMDAPGELV